MRDLKELKLWLEGTEPAQVAWRVDNKNMAQVSEVVTQYAATVGGKSGSVVWDRINKEKEAIKRAAKAEEKAKERHEALVGAVRDDYLANGGLEKDFEARKSSILESYALSGRAKKVLGQTERERRSQAARTF